MCFMLGIILGLEIKLLIHEIKEFIRVLKGDIKDDDYDDFILK